MTNPLRSLRRVPVAGVLAEREMGGYLFISALVGVGVGLGAAALVFLLDTFDRLLQPFFGPLFDPATHGWFNPSRTLVFLSIPLGLVLAWWIARRWAPEVGGDGVPQTVEALTVHGGRMRGRVAPLKVLTTALTVGFGGSAGREGPIVRVGGAVGSWISRRFGLGEDQIRSIAAIQLGVLKARLAKMEYGFEISDAAIGELAKVGFDPVYGARPLKRAIQSEIENPLAKAILEGRFAPKDTIAVDYRGGKIVFEKKKTVKAAA